jgi:predicted transposase YbfD/YdcC
MLLAKSLRAIERLSRDLADSGRIKGLLRRVADSTLGDFLCRLSPTDLRRHLHQQIHTEHRRKALEPTVLPIRCIAIDGKTTATLDFEAHRNCQKQSPENQPPYWLHRVVNATLISASAAVCIDQIPIAAKTNDMGIFPKFWKKLLETYGRTNLFELVTMDSGFCSEKNARLIDKSQKAYWISLKDNQPELKREAERVLQAKAKREAPEAQKDWEQDSSRGWIRRQLWRSTEMAGWGKWSHLRQVVLLRVLARQPDGTERVLEDRYYVTNLVYGRLDGAQLIRLARAHWRIENDLHGALDIQWQEDHSRWVQRKNGLIVSSLLRVIAYNLMSLLRAVHLRTIEARSAAWEQLRDWVRDAMLWPDLVPADHEVTTAAP